MLHNESPAPYEGRHRVPDDDYWLRLVNGTIRNHVRPHTPRHSAEVSPFAIAFFGAPITPAHLVSYVGNPLASDSPFEPHEKELDAHGGGPMSKIGPHKTVVFVEIGDCPACAKAISAEVTASVSVTATGVKPSARDTSVIRLSYDGVKVEHARISHDCGPKAATS